MAHTRQEKIDKVEAICKLYESDGITIDSACEANGIARTTFFGWIKDDESEQFAQRYKKAKHGQECFLKQRIRQKAISSLEKGVHGWEYEEVTTEGREVDGNFKAVKQVKKTVKVLPNATLVMYALNNSNNEGDNEFNHVSHVKQENKTDITIKSDLPDWVLNLKKGGGVKDDEQKD